MADNGGDLMGTGRGCGPERRHIPVLLAEVLDKLHPQDGEIYIDGTFGAGGYTSAILDAASCHVLALDRDPQAIANGAALREQYAPRLDLKMMPFGNLQDAVADLSEPSVDGIVLDIGVSSMQLDQADRGFSFANDGPLDMRMFAAGGEQSEASPSAADLVNELEQSNLADIIYHYGEERRSRAIAAAIVRARAQAPLERTLQLADICTRVYGRRTNDKVHPATRTFQALRIAVNDELGELVRALSAAERVLRPGGRLVVVTFHSLEDRIVKRFFATRAGKTAGGSRHLPESIQFETPSFQIVNQRPLVPSNQEIAVNPRSRSAKLRYGI
ncbi:MAG: 16S rRNA (cytosine(1402)-N(4))-methyltransferase RsmH, partial [Pseudomonadota bacterium]